MSGRHAIQRLVFRKPLQFVNPENGQEPLALAEMVMLRDPHLQIIEGNLVPLILSSLRFAN